MASLFQTDNRFDNNSDEEEEEESLEDDSQEEEEEEEFAGGMIGHDTTHTTTAEDTILEGVSRIVEEDYNGMDQVMEEAQEEERVPFMSPKKSKLAGAARIQLPTSNTTFLDLTPPDRFLLEPLTEAVFRRGYRPGLGLDSRAILHYRLKRVLFDDPNLDNEDEDAPSRNNSSNSLLLTWLTKPLIQALLDNTPENVSLQVMPLHHNNNDTKTTTMEPQSLLHWVCQWKLLQLQCGWRGHDDMVELLLKAGAPVNATTSLQCTPLFFAVKYGTVDTCRLLLEAGARVNHRDARNQTCLRNILPQANPYILKLLIQHGLPVATETFVVTDTLESRRLASNKPKQKKKQQPQPLRINALDILLTEFVTPHPDVSWATLGMASVDDYALCALLLLQQGLQLSPHYVDAQYFLGHYLQGSVQSLKRAYYTVRMAALFTGQWLPVAAKEPLALWKEEEEETKMEFNQTVTISYNASKSTTTTPLDKHGRRRVGLSQLTAEQLQFECEARNLVVAQTKIKENCIDSLVHDWQDFTLPQGLEEDNASQQDNGTATRLVAELTLRNTMISEDNYLWVAASKGCVMIPITVKGIPIFALLSTTSPYTVLSPHFVKTYGFSLNQELQTMTTEDPLKFIRADNNDHDNQNPEDVPRSNDPADAPPPPRPKVITAPKVCLTSVQDFSFALGKSGIRVALPSAVQAYEPQSLNWPVGVILGLDFFRSAAWTQLTVEVDLQVCLGRTMGLLTGHATSKSLDFDLLEPRRAKHVEEDFRYYSKDGKIFWSPLWHISISANDNCLSLGQYMRDRLPYCKEKQHQKENGSVAGTTVCAWCGRNFPYVPPEKEKSWSDWVLSRPMSSGMLPCGQFKKDGKVTTTYYCNNECWRQGGVALPVDPRKQRSYSAWFLKLLVALLLAGFVLVTLFSGFTSSNNTSSSPTLFLDNETLGDSPATIEVSPSVEEEL